MKASWRIASVLLILISFPAAHGSDFPPEPEAPDWLPDREGLLGIVVERSFLERLPGSDGWQRTCYSPAGVQPDRNPSILGASNWDNRYRTDWVDTTDPAKGPYSASLIPDSMQRFQVAAAGLPARTGLLQGGLIRTETRSGSDRFHGILRVRYREESWQADDRRTGAEPTDRNRWEPSVWLGGPVVPGRVWVSAAYMRWERQDWVELYHPLDYPIWTYDHRIRTVEDRPFIRLDLEPGCEHQIAAIWGTNRYWSPRTEGDSFRETIVQWGEERPFMGAKWNWQIDAVTGIRLQAGTSQVIRRDTPADGDQETPAIVYRNGVRGENYHRWSEDHRRRTNAVLELERSSATESGRHRILVGIESRWDLWRVIDRYNGGGYYEFDGCSSTLDAVTRSEDVRTYRGEGWSLHAQDEWSLPSRLSLHPGLRYDIQTFETHQGEKARIRSDFPSPRLGMVWQPWTNRSEEIRAFLGRYHETGDLQLSELASEPAYDIHWSAPWESWPQRPFDDPAWEYTGGEPGPFGRFDPDLKPQRTDEALLSIRRDLTKGISAEAAVVYRRTRDVIESVGLFIDPETGQEYDAFQLRNRPDLWDRWPDGPDAYLITNPADARRDYRGLLLSARGQRERFQWYATYTWSRSEGTVTGNPPHGFNPVRFTSAYDTPSLCEGLEGRLPWDAPHALAFRGVVDLPCPDRWPTYLGLAIQSRSGFPYDRWTEPADGMYPGYGSLEDRGRGSERSGWTTQVDLSVQQDLRFGAWGTWTVILDVFNLFDQQTPITHREEVWSNQPWEYGDAKTYQAPRTYSFQVKYTF